MSVNRVLIIMEEQGTALGDGGQLRFLLDVLRMTKAKQLGCLVKCKRFVPMVCSCISGDLSPAAVVSSMMHVGYHCEVLRSPRPFAEALGVRRADDSAWGGSARHDGEDHVSESGELLGHLSAVLRRASDSTPPIADIPALRHLFDDFDLAVCLGGAAQSDDDGRSGDAWAAGVVEAVGVPIWSGPREYFGMHRFVFSSPLKVDKPIAYAFPEAVVRRLRARITGWTGPIEVCDWRELLERISPGDCLVMEQPKRNWWRRLLGFPQPLPKGFRVSCPRLLLPSGSMAF